MITFEEIYNVVQMSSAKIRNRKCIIIFLPRGCSSSKSLRYRELWRDVLGPSKSDEDFQNSEFFDETWIK